jgi:hypothetical protein
MQRHHFDPVSAALGVLVVALGVLVVTGELGAFDTDGGWWFALAAIVLGIAIIPWRRASGARGEVIDEHVVDEESARED